MVLTARDIKGKDIADNFKKVILINFISSAFSPTFYLPSSSFTPLHHITKTILLKEGLDADFFQLDIANDESISQFAKYMQEKYHKCHILINNAGIFISNWDQKTFDLTLPTNLFGILSTTIISHFFWYLFFRTNKTNPSSITAHKASRNSEYSKCFKWIWQSQIS